MALLSLLISLISQTVHCETSGTLYGTVFDSIGGRSDLAIEAWSYSEAGSGITVYEIPAEPEVGTACAIEAQYTIERNTGEFGAQKMYTYCDGFAADNILAITTAQYAYKYNITAGNSIIFRKLVSQMFASPKQSAAEIRELLGNLTLGVQQTKKDEHKYPNTRYWHAGLIRYEHIMIEINPGPYGNVLSAKIVRKNAE
jgi:hypothetical protein